MAILFAVIIPMLLCWYFAWFLRTQVIPKVSRFGTLFTFIGGFCPVLNWIIFVVVFIWLLMELELYGDMKLKETKFTRFFFDTKFPKN